jgi:hypothetical protein
VPSPLMMSLIVFVVILCGVVIGAALRHVLPDEHLTGDSKDMIRLGSGLVATIAALVLGLLISSAKGSFDVQRNEVRDIAANLVVLDRTLKEYGPQTAEIRGLLREAVEPWIALIWREQAGPFRPVGPVKVNGSAERAYAEIAGIEPSTDAQRILKAEALQLVSSLAQARFLLFEQSDGGIPLPFLAVLVFWLTIIFASFSLFSPLNTTSFAALTVFAFSAAGAIFLILEMDQPFTGLMRISSEPLRQALLPLAI